MQTLIGILVSLAATWAVAQAPSPKSPPTPPAVSSQAYTPDPVATTYRPLIGRLFFSDAERERLDRARKDGVQIIDGEAVARSPQLNGFVIRSDGRTTYWVEGGQRRVAGVATEMKVASSMTGAEPSVIFKPSTPPMIAPATPARKATKPAAKQQ